MISCTLARMRLALSVLCLPLLASTVSAQSVKLVRSVDAPRQGGGFASVLADRYVAPGYPKRMPEGQAVPSELVFPVLDARSGALVEAKLGISKFVKEHDKAFMAGAVITRPKGNKTLEVTFELVHYDPESGHAGLLLHDTRSAKKGVDYRYYYAPWDLKAERIGKPVPLTEPGPAVVHALGATKDTVFCSIERPGADKREVSAVGLDVETGKESWKHDFTAPLRNQQLAGHFYHVADTGFDKLAFVEYSEKAYGPLSPPATGFVIDRKKDGEVTFPVPLSPYGLAFSPDGKELVVASAELAQVARVDLATKKSSAPTKIGKGLQRLALTGKTIFLFFGQGKTIETLSWPALKPKKKLPVAKSIKGSKALDSETSVVLDGGKRIAVADLDGKRIHILDLVD